MQIFKEQPLISALMFLFMGLSITGRIFLGVAYSRLILETDNMSATKNKLLKQCKLKFSNCYEMNNGVANVSVFVDKFLNRMEIGPVSFEAVYHFSGQFMFLSVLFSGVGACTGIMRAYTLGAILPYYIVSFIGLYIFFSVSSLADIKGKKNILKINLVDYLENHFLPRVQVTKVNEERLRNMSSENKEIPQQEAISEEELEALLREFLIG